MNTTEPKQNEFAIQLLNSKLAMERWSKKFHRLNPICPHCNKNIG